MPWVRVGPEGSQMLLIKGGALGSRVLGVSLHEGTLKSPAPPVAQSSTQETFVNGISEPSPTRFTTCVSVCSFT